ncbi:MAG TPA: PhoU domain-containing protein [Nitriliruptorales bacterium]
MVLEVFRQSDRLQKVSDQITRMLNESRHVFDEAMSALLAGADPAALDDDIHGTDRRINALEQEIRRELVIHTSVRGTADITAVLILLMVGRKIERMGDNAKNIYDIAAQGIDLAEAPDHAELAGYRDEVSQAITRAGEVFNSGDVEAARTFAERMVQLQREFDQHVDTLIVSDAPSTHGVPRALLYRYLKRIVANLEGMASAVANPFDLIDYTPEGDEQGET